MQFQVCSDLHLEFYSDYIDLDNFLIPAADYLIVAGNICPFDHPNFQRFFNYFSSRFREIFFVAGNHEFYTYNDYPCYKQDNSLCPLAIDRVIPLEEIKRLIKSLMDSYDNVHFLNGDKFTIIDEEGNETIILGTTMWSHIPQENIEAIPSLINDYIFIRENNNRNLLPSDINRRHKLEKEWLISTLNSLSSSSSVIIITHHLPSYSLIDIHYKENLGQLMNCSFASHLDDIILNYPQIKIWTYGHTHKPRRAKIGSTLMICNPKGYPYQNKNYNLTSLF